MSVLSEWQSEKALFPAFFLSRDQMWILWGKKKEQRSVWKVRVVDMLRPQLPTVCYLLEWDNTPLSTHSSPACALALHIQLVMTSKGHLTA